METDQADVSQFYHIFYLYNYFCVYTFICETDDFGGSGFDGRRFHGFQFVDWYEYASVSEAALSVRARAHVTELGAATELGEKTH